MKHKTKAKRPAPRVKTSEGFQERNKESGPSQTETSQWDQEMRKVSSLASRPASPATPSMPDGWNDEALFTDNKATGTFTAGELGQPDSDRKPDAGNSGGVQGGRGPLNEEGEGDRQNDQLAELESDVDAAKDLERRR